MRVAHSAWFILSLLCFLSLCVAPAVSRAGNVTWTIGDFVSACPAGDSVVAGHPAVLRIAINYKNNLGVNNAGVPPESIWVTMTHASNSWITLYDAAAASDGYQWKVFADDYTDDQGNTRFSVTGFGGCGGVLMRIYVSGVQVGTAGATVRSLDADDHDPVSVEGDSTGACDFNYDGVINSTDYALIRAHQDHGHRNALHGAMVRRTYLCTTCVEGDPNTLGESGATWSPSSTRLGLSIFDANRDCAIFLTPANAEDGNTLTHLTFPQSGDHDYDPEWSPFGDVMAWDRADNTCYRKGIPGIATDTSVVRITTFNNGGTPPRGDINPAISPDGQWVVFARKEALHDGISAWHLWKIPIAGIDGGATATQLTSSDYGGDVFPRWSPDGQKIYFERQEGYNGPIRVYSINPDGSAPDSVLAPSETFAAATPGVSPDGKVLVAAVGSVDSVKTRTLRLGLGHVNSLDKTVENYPRYHVSEGSSPNLAPRVSPDGTRLTIRALVPGTSELPEIWASRRNMSLPPKIDALGGTAVNHATPVLDFTAYAGTALTLVVEASDPESDALTYKAYFLRTDLGMDFNEYTQTFSWTPNGAQVGEGQVYFVRFQVETVSGGTDYAIARITIGTGGGSGCPTLASYTGRGWKTENTILGRSKTGIYLVDAYKLREKPARVQDRYRLQIRETEQEKTTLDQVRLLAVDHDPKLTAVASEGAVWTGERKPAYRVRTSGGQDVTHPISGLFGGSPGEILLVDMEDPDHPSGPGPGIFDGGPGEKDGPQLGNLKPSGAVAASALDASLLDGSGFAVEGGDGVGGWKGLASSYPRELGGETVIEGAGQGQVRVAFKGRQHLTFIGKLAGATQATPQELPLVIARHSRFKDVRATVGTLGGQATTIEPGETLDLEFSAPPVPEGMARDLFLVSRGVYTAYLPGMAAQSGLPVRFALAQNRPNPFGSTTSIRFELPVKAKVRLEVFDLLGRRVRLLADQEFEAGYQSVEWDGKDRSGTAAGPGVYLYRMTTPGFREEKKMILLP